MVHIRVDESLGPVWLGVHISELVLCLIALLTIVYVRSKGETATLLLRWVTAVSCFGILQALFWLLAPQDTLDTVWVIAAWLESMFFSAAFALQVYLLFYCFASTARLEFSSSQVFSRLRPLFILLIFVEVALDVCIRALFTKLSFSTNLDEDQVQRMYGSLTIAQYSMYSLFELGMTLGTLVDIRRLQRLRALLSGARTAGAFTVQLVLRQMIWTGLLGLSFTVMSWAQVCLWFYEAPAEAITTLVLEAFRHYAIYCHLLFTLVNLSVLLNKSDLTRTPLLSSASRESLSHASELERSSTA